MEKKDSNLTFHREVKGAVKKFWVQILPEDQKKKAVEIFRKYFVRDEPMCKSINLIDDKESLDYYMKFLWCAINQNSSLACFIELDDGQEEMVAVNVCYRNTAYKEIMEMPGFRDIPEGMNNIFEILKYIITQKEIPKELEVAEYLTSIGLIVIPEYRGLNIGLQVLSARKMLCEKMGLKVSVTTFTAPESQRLAEKAGYKDLVSLTYDDLQKMKPSSIFPDINKYAKRVRHMYILYE
ncbi:uncharacterized protein LOC123688059 [Harmonia axyridis]|uniref:uncharacterized protein LOC123688059 n=1 Tax=Harmonia axyridis TaxID=115357 RepID=UPI001E2787A9|nr:uncharacterized protein LOC123688059 [Harmonia axyridis]